MITPAYLQAGDTVTLISTARKVSKEELTPAITVLESWGLIVKLGANLFAEDSQFAGTDDQRAADLQAALDDESSKAIICVRGGYGTVRIIDQIDFSEFIKKPKWVCGFSDVTVIHSTLHNLGIQSIHATMPLLFSKIEQQEAVETLRKALFGETLTYQFPVHPLNKGRKMQGELIGGNLSIINNLIGTPTDINTKGKILFLEDLDEYLYHVDRMMVHLKRAGLLSQLSGVLIGHMSAMNDNVIPFGKTAYEIISEAVKEYDYPAFFDFPAGHLNHNYAIKLGGKVLVEVKEEMILFTAKE